MNAIEKKIEISDVFVLELLRTLNLFETSDGKRFYDIDHMENSRKFLTRFLKSLGYDEIKWIDKRI